MVGHICKALRNISNPTKMVPTKQEKLNIKLFNLHRRSLNGVQTLGVVKNVEIFGGAPEDDERINGKVGDQELRQQNHWDFASVLQ